MNTIMEILTPVWKYKTMSTCDVRKLIPVALDLGNVVLFDVNPFEEDKICAGVKREEREAYLEALTRENAQLLFNGLYSLPQEESDEMGRIVSLPKASTVIPREKQVPTDKPLTRWEKFAKVKGIHKEKRSAKVFDEVSGEWKYRHGSKSAGNDPLAGWCEEVEE